MMNRNTGSSILGLGLAGLIFAIGVSAAETADVVFRNGKVYTLDAKRPWAESVAVKGETIAYVGSNRGSRAWTGPATRVVDLKGGMLLPGFIDGHNHYVSGASAKRGVRLVGAKDKQELLRRIGAYVQANPGRTGYMGYGWEFPMFGAEGATRQELDAICSDKPMLFLNEDSHHGWFNSQFMKVGGVTRDTPDPRPGNTYFRREADGTPSGVSIEPETWIPVAIQAGLLGGKEMIQESVDEMFPALPKMGITAYHDMGINAPDFAHGYIGYEVLLEREKAGQLPVRVVGTYALRELKEDPGETLQLLKDWNGRYRSDLVQVTGLKLWADGTYVSHTAVQVEPYVDEPSSHGESGWTTELLARWVEAAYVAGFDVNIHTEGDGSTRRGLDAVEQVTRKIGPTDRRTTLHHITVIHPADLPRFRALGVGGNMTPVWLGDYKDQWKDALRILGREKVAKEFGLARALMETGANVTFGSDLPGTDVEEASPLYQIQAAVTGLVPGYPRTAVPLRVDKRPTLKQMLQGYTLNGARQMRMADRIGSIEAGKLADLVVLEKNLFRVPANRIAATKVVMTMMNGTITYPGK